MKKYLFKTEQGNIIKLTWDDYCKRSFNSKLLKVGEEKDKVYPKEEEVEVDDTQVIRPKKHKKHKEEDN